MQTAEVPICFCHVQVAEDISRMRKAHRKAPSDSDGDVEDHHKALGLAKTIAIAGSTEAVANLGVRAESTAPAATVDNYFYQAAILILTVCTIASILMSATSGRVLRSSYYTLARMLWDIIATLLGLFAREPAEVAAPVNIVCNPIFENDNICSEGDLFCGFEFQVPIAPTGLEWVPHVSHVKVDAYPLHVYVLWPL